MASIHLHDKFEEQAEEEENHERAGLLGELTLSGSS